MDKINFMDKKLPGFVINCANSGMREYMGGMNRLSHVSSEIFGTVYDLR